MKKHQWTYQLCFVLMASRACNSATFTAVYLELSFQMDRDGALSDCVQVRFFFKQDSELSWSKGEQRIIAT